MTKSYCIITVSAKFVYDSDITVVRNPSGEYKDFVDAIGDLLEVVGRVSTELPLYKFYNNDLLQKYTNCMKVCGCSYLN